MPFDAQHAYYQELYAGAAFDVILVDGHSAGRLYVAHEEDEIASSTSRSCPSTATAASGRRCCANCNQRRRPPAGRCASTSNALIPRCGSTSGSGSIRSPIAGFICSWNGRGSETLRLVRATATCLQARNRRPGGQEKAIGFLLISRALLLSRPAINQPFTAESTLMPRAPGRSFLCTRRGRDTFEGH